jgi:hypothetical protein
MTARFWQSYPGLVEHYAPRPASVRSIGEGIEFHHEALQRCGGPFIQRHIRLHGLKARAELNELTGIAVRFDPAKGRYHVKLINGEGVRERVCDRSASKGFHRRS